MKHPVVVPLFALFTLLLAGCWDEITHNYDCGDCPEVEIGGLGCRRQTHGTSSNEASPAGKCPCTLPQ